MTNTSALAVMLKSPDPGSVKTRLVPPLTHEQAAGLYECFISDVLAKATSLKDVEIYAAHTPESDREKILRLLPERVRLISQSGDGLGERIVSVFNTLFSMGYFKVVVIGSDSPDLPPEFIEKALSALDGVVSLVLGPAADGGYYLVALDRFTEAPFKGIPWSTGEVLSKTLEKADEASIKYCLLDKWHDIDTEADLPRLKENPGAPASSKFIRALGV